MCRGLHCRGCRSGAQNSDGGVGVLVVLAVIVAVAALGYRAADSALAGLAASTAAANQVLAWALAAVGIIAAVTAGGWVLLARHRSVREAPTVAAFHARVDAALAARDATRAPLDPGRPRPIEGPVRANAVRLDRHSPGAGGGAR